NSGFGAAVAEVDREDPVGHSHTPSGATSCMASSTPDINWFNVWLPEGVPPKPYIAPDSAGVPTFARAYSTDSARAATNDCATPSRVFGRVTQKCSAGGN